MVATRIASIAECRHDNPIHRLDVVQNTLKLSQYLACGSEGERASERARQRARARASEWERKREREEGEERREEREKIQRESERAGGGGGKRERLKIFNWNYTAVWGHLWWRHMRHMVWLKIDYRMYAYVTSARQKYYLSWYTSQL